MITVCCNTKSIPKYSANQGKINEIEMFKFQMNSIAISFTATRPASLINIKAIMKFPTILIIKDLKMRCLFNRMKGTLKKFSKMLTNFLGK